MTVCRDEATVTTIIEVLLSFHQPTPLLCDFKLVNSLNKVYICFDGIKDHISIMIQSQSTTNKKLFMYDFKLGDLQPFFSLAYRGIHATFRTFSLGDYQYILVAPRLGRMISMNICQVPWRPYAILLDRSSRRKQATFTWIRLGAER